MELGHYLTHLAPSFVDFRAVCGFSTGEPGSTSTSVYLYMVDCKDCLREEIRRQGKRIRELEGKDGTIEGALGPVR